MGEKRIKLMLLAFLSFAEVAQQNRPAPWKIWVVETKWVFVAMFLHSLGFYFSGIIAGPGIMSMSTVM